MANNGLASSQRKVVGSLTLDRWRTTGWQFARKSRWIDGRWMVGIRLRSRRRAEARHESCYGVGQAQGPSADLLNANDPSTRPYVYAATVRHCPTSSIHRLFLAVKPARRSPSIQRHRSNDLSLRCSQPVVRHRSNVIDPSTFPCDVASPSFAIDPTSSIHRPFPAM
jgi:hypothetical protein